MSDTTQTVDQTDDKSISSDDLAALLETEKARAAAASARAEASEARATAAERANAEVSGRLRTETDGRFKAEETALENAITAATADADRLESTIAALYQDGKFAEVAKAQRELALVQARTAQFEARKEWMGQQKQQAAAEPPRQQAQQPADPMASFSAAARAWIGNHPKFLTDPSYQKRVIGAHHLAAADGHTIDSPEYFAAIEAIVEPKRADSHAEAEAPQRGAAPPSLPVARRIATAPHQPSQVRLSADEREMADVALPHIKDSAERYKRYAELQSHLRQEGRIGR
jgi:hypothetical protein